MIRGASVIGREHVRLGRNNQDAWACAERGAVRAAVVTDGCSSEKSSEVGAQLAARWLANWVTEHAAPEAVGPDLATRATHALTAWLYRLAGTFDGEFVDAVQRHLLFTFLCAVSSEHRSLVFGVGDGVVVVDDDVVRLDSGDDNAPNYVAYRLLSGPKSDLLEPRVHFWGDAHARIAVLTDGFVSLPTGTVQSFCDLGDSTNPLSLQRRLNVLAEAERLGDDATAAVVVNPNQPRRA